MAVMVVRGDSARPATPSASAEILIPAA